jgi:hypothetical protein
MADKLRSSGVPDVSALAQRAKNLAEDGKVDPVNGLSKDRVYLFSGGEDRIVARSAVREHRASTRRWCSGRISLCTGWPTP